LGGLRGLCKRDGGREKSGELVLQKTADGGRNFLPERGGRKEVAGGKKKNNDGMGHWGRVGGGPRNTASRGRIVVKGIDQRKNLERCGGNSKSTRKVKRKGGLGTWPWGGGVGEKTASL